MYLEKFVLPNEDEEYALAAKKRVENGGGFGYLDNAYPCGLFLEKELSELDFEKTTILYGGNGSGKSTLLNLIAGKLNLKRLAPFNDSELFSLFVEKCRYRTEKDEKGKARGIPQNSMIISSDDVFDYMLAARTTNEEVGENIEQGRRDYAALKFGETVKFSGMQDYEQVRMQVLSRRKSLSRRFFLRQFAGTEIKLNSNGETAMDFFNRNIQNDTLYFLDEPENSLSPQMQLELKGFLENKTKYGGCQFVIATHSPFILATAGAKIYDLDSTPVSLKKWWEVNNTQTYFDFFFSNKDLFLKNK